MKTFLHNLTYTTATASDRVPNLPKLAFFTPINIGPIEAQIALLRVTPQNPVLGSKNPRELLIPDSALDSA